MQAYTNTEVVVCSIPDCEHSYHLCSLPLRINLRLVWNHGTSCSSRCITIACSSSVIWLHDWLGNHGFVQMSYFAHKHIQIPSNNKIAHPRGRTERHTLMSCNPIEISPSVDGNSNPAYPNRPSELETCRCVYRTPRTAMRVVRQL